MYARGVAAKGDAQDSIQPHEPAQRHHHGSARLTTEEGDAGSAGLPRPRPPGGGKHLVVGPQLQFPGRHPIAGPLGHSHQLGQVGDGSAFSLQGGIPRNGLHKQRERQAFHFPELENLGI